MMSVEIYEDTINFTLRHAKQYLLDCLSVENGFSVYSHIPIDAKEIDLLLKDGDTIIVELKATKADIEAVKQVLVYRELYYHAHGVQAIPYVLAPSYVANVEHYARKKGVILAQFDRNRIVNEYFNLARALEIDYFILNTMNIPNPQVNHFTYSNELLYYLYQMGAVDRIASFRELNDFLLERGRNLKLSTLKNRLRLAVEFGLCHIYGDKVSLSADGKKLIELGLAELKILSSVTERERGLLFQKSFTSSQQAFLQMELTKGTYFSWYKTGIAECLETLKQLMGPKAQPIPFAEYLDWYQRRIGKKWERQDAILWYAHACEDLGLVIIGLEKGKRPKNIAITQRGLELIEILRGNKEVKRRIIDFVMRNYVNDTFVMSIL
jgi:hypothetical protein